ncbi:hypothetical protein AC579_8983 [Pseudocercospora musae]|uniref:Uncharacterized protein n=1 Tax=Pseudocercospora musae TaxID=113226 RepID=A0A139HNY5_9PEZI|nr:hypothetical protein AC579_8983 [Pseudocercospora musae]
MAPKSPSLMKVRNTPVQQSSQGEPQQGPSQHPQQPQQQVAQGTKRTHEDDELDDDDELNQDPGLDDDVMPTTELDADNNAFEDTVAKTLLAKPMRQHSTESFTNQTADDEEELEDILQRAEYENAYVDDSFDDIFIIPGANDIEDSATVAQPTFAPGLMGPPARTYPGLGVDTSQIYNQKPGCEVTRISSIKLEFALWLREEGISRGLYASLRGILASSTDTDLKTLPDTVDTLKLHLKSVLPLLSLRVKEVATMDENKMARLLAGLKVSRAGKKEALFFFDPEELFSCILSSALFQKMYKGLSQSSLTILRSCGNR